MTGYLTTEGSLEIHLNNSTTANPMLLLHNQGAVWGNMTYRRDTIFHFVNTSDSVGVDYRPLKARYYLAYTTDLCTNLNADLLDGHQENAFLRYRGATSTAGDNTLWAQIGIKEYHNSYPDSLSGVYNYGAVVSLPSSNARLDIWYNHQSSGQANNGIQYRSGWGNDKKPWRMILDSVNYTNYADGRYVNVSGDTMTGVLNFANGTRNSVGDDCGFGDGNVGGCTCFQGLNGDTGIALIQRGAAWSGGNHYRFTWNGSNMTSSSTAQWNNLNADLLDGKHESAFTSIIGRHSFNTDGTAPYAYIHLFRIANSNGYSTLRVDIDFKSRNHAATLYIDIVANQYPYNSGGTSINIYKETKSGRTCTFYVKQTIQSSNYNYYDIYYYSGAWNTGSYDVKLRGINGGFIFEPKNQKIDSLPSGCSTVTETSFFGNAVSANQLYTTRTIFGQPFNGTQNVGGLMTSTSVFVQTSDATLKVYDGRQQDGISDGNICLQTSIDGTDGQSHSYPTQYQSRCNLCLQPRGGQVYIGQNPNGGSTSYKLVVNGGMCLNGASRMNFGGTNHQMYYSGNDNANEVGNSTLSNLVINSWFGVSFTTTCGSTYQNKIAMSINCRTGRVTADNFHAATNITANGAITAKASSSDIRLKRDIKDFSAMDILRKIQPKQFYWNELAKSNSPALNNDYRQYGLIAQSIQNMPELEGFVDNVFKDYLIIHYEKFIPIALEGLKEVDDEVTKLKRRVEVLERENEMLKRRIPA